MNYLITPNVTNSTGPLEISKSEYRFLRDARKNILESVYLEEKLDLLLENFNEFECTALSIASQHSVFSNLDYFSINFDRNLLSRRFVNLLSSGRMYLEHCIHHLENIYGIGHEYIECISKEKASKYDQYFGFRVMEAMRNYVLHQGLALHSLIVQFQNVGIGTDVQLLHRVVPKIKISTLAEDKSFKRNIISELQSKYQQDDIDIRPLLREYFEAIGLIHLKIREVIEIDYNNWDTSIGNQYSKFQNISGNETPVKSLELIIINEEGKIIERLALLQEFSERRRRLVSKNLSFQNLSKCFTTNQIN